MAARDFEESRAWIVEVWLADLAFAGWDVGVGVIEGVVERWEDGVAEAVLDAEAGKGRYVMDVKWLGW